MTSPSVTYRGARRLSPAPAVQSSAMNLRRVSRVVSIGVPVATTVLALVQTSAADVGDYGLVSAVPWYGLLGFVALALVAVAAIHAKPFDESFAGSAVTAFVLLLSAAPAIVYDTTRFSWAFKHVGIVDYLDRTGSFDQSIDVLPIYHSWPGFFAGSGSLTRWLGFDDAIAVAAWAPVVLNSLTLLSLVFLFGTLCSSRSTVWMASLLFFATNWIGQDYFSPQAIAYIFYLNIIALTLRFYHDRSENTSPPFVVHIVMTALILALTVSHQLTPMVLFLSLLGLLLFRQHRAWWLPILVGLSVAGWVGSWARIYFLDNVLDELSGGVGSPVDNAGATLGKAVDRSEAQVWVGASGRILVAVMVTVALAGLVLRYRRTQNTVVPLVLLGSPMVLLVLQFGGEVLFRVVLFMLPMLVLLAAEMLQSFEGERANIWLARTVVMLCLPLLALATFGKDSFYTFSSSELEVSTELSLLAPENSLLIEGSRNYPSQFRNYEKFTYVPIERESASTQLRLAEDPADELFRWLDQDEYAATYLLLTRSQHRQGEALGSLPENFVPDAERALRNDQRFDVLLEGTHAVVFVIAP